MDGLDKIYQMQKQAAGVGKLPWYKKLISRWYEKVDKPIDLNKIKAQHVDTGGTESLLSKNVLPGGLHPKASKTGLYPQGRLKFEHIIPDSILVTLAGKQINDWRSDEPTEASNGGQQSSKPAEASNGGQQSSKPAEAAGEGKDNGDGEQPDAANTTVNNQSVWDSAVKWVEEHPILAGAGALGLGGLGYYAFSDDDDEDEEE